MSPIVRWRNICEECGSARIAEDAGGLRYCRECGRLLSR